MDLSNLLTSLPDLNISHMWRFGYMQGPNGSMPNSTNREECVQQVDQIDKSSFVRTGNPASLIANHVWKFGL